jgi:hypothetical protein
MQVAGEDAQAITGFFRLAAVRIVDAQAKVCFLRGDQRQDPVAAQSPMAIANAADFSGGEFKRQFRGVHHHIVVTESVSAEKPVLHLRAPSRRLSLVKREARNNTWTDSDSSMGSARG